MITDIYLQRFRSYKDESFELSPGVNIIIGPNASGKTNLLEAILVVARGSSYRAKDTELIRFDAPWARVEAHTSKNENRVVKLEAENGRVHKSYQLGGQSLRRLNPAKTLPVVLFEPDHLQLFNGSPELRRQFLDGLLEQTVVGYGLVGRQYRRALSQRNTLLKNGSHKVGNQLFAWNIRLSELGAQIAASRAQMVAAMNSQIGVLYDKMSKTKEKIEVSYASTIPIKNYASALLDKLEANKATDLERGFTAHGPHRDDLLIFINGRPMQQTASRGENRTLLLALKMLEAQQLDKMRGTKPMLLLDDVFSELDGRRRQMLTKFLKPYQTFITTTDADVVLQHFTETTNIIPLGKNTSSINF